MKKLLMMIGAAAVAVGANAATQVVTNTVDGVTCSPSSDLKWRIKIDTVAKTAMLGVGGNNGRYNGALSSYTGDNLSIPSYFTVGGVDYKTISIAGRGFYYLYMKNLLIPEEVTGFSSYCFVGCNQMKNMLFKGPVTVGTGGTQTFASLGFADTQWSSFNGCSALRFILLGPNTKIGGTSPNFFLPDANGATVVVPSRSDNTTWDAVTEETISASGKSNKVVRYGPDYDFDMTMGETAMTFYPKTETALTNIISWASTFKSAFDMDTKIAITNRIEMSEGVQITEAMLQNVTLEAPPWYLTFAVKNQAQLDNVLAAVSADVPIIIDIDGAGKNQITVPNGRKVAILAKSGWTFGKKLNGLIISFF